MAKKQTKTLYGIYDKEGYLLALEDETVDIGQTPLVFKSIKDAKQSEHYHPEEGDYIKKISKKELEIL